MAIPFINNSIFYIHSVFIPDGVHSWHNSNFVTKSILKKDNNYLHWHLKYIFILKSLPQVFDILSLQYSSAKRRTMTDLCYNSNTIFLIECLSFLKINLAISDGNQEMLFLLQVFFHTYLFLPSSFFALHY